MAAISGPWLVYGMSVTGGGVRLSRVTRHRAGEGSVLVSASILGACRCGIGGHEHVLDRGE
jgi:hypothetical protein